MNGFLIIGTQETMNYEEEKKMINEIREKEYLLLEDAVRENAEEVMKLISEDFCEHCSSGVIYRYKKGDTFGKRNYDFSIEGFEGEVLSENAILVRYHLKESISGEVKRESLRSSIWKKVDGNWKMIFHQGTNIKKGN